MQDILLTLIVFGGLSMIFMTIFGFFAYLRYLKHKETIALVEKGLLKPENVVQYNGSQNGDKRLLNRAIILIAIGFALCLGLFPIGFLVSDELPLYLGPWLLVGFLPLFFGIALLIIYILPLLPGLLNQFPAVYRSDILPTSPGTTTFIAETQSPASDSVPLQPDNHYAGDK